MQVYSVHRLLQYKIYQSVVIYQSQYHNAIYQSQYSELLNIEIGLQVGLQQAVATQQSPTQVVSNLTVFKEANTPQSPTKVVLHIHYAFQENMCTMKVFIHFCSTNLILRQYANSLFFSAPVILQHY